MSERDRITVREVRERCQDARRRLAGLGSFRLRVLFDLVLIELAREIERLEGPP